MVDTSYPGKVPSQQSSSAVPSLSWDTASRCNCPRLLSSLVLGDIAQQRRSCLKGSTSPETGISLMPRSGPSCQPAQAAPSRHNPDCGTEKSPGRRNVGFAPSQPITEITRDTNLDWKPGQGSEKLSVSSAAESLLCQHSPALGGKGTQTPSSGSACCPLCQQPPQWVTFLFKSILLLFGCLQVCMTNSGTSHPS